MGDRRKRHGHRRVIPTRDKREKCPNCGRVMTGAWPFYNCPKDGLVKLS